MSRSLIRRVLRSVLVPRLIEVSGLEWLTEHGRSGCGRFIVRTTRC